MDRRNRDQDRIKREVDTLVHEEEEERRAETERRGEELRESWRPNHPQEEGEDREQDRRKRGRSS